MAARLEDLQGQFGWLTVIERAPQPEGIEHRLSFFKCRCRCGAEVIVRSDSLRGGTRRKCSVDCPHKETKIRITRTEVSRRGIEHILIYGGNNE